jgi:hypothetical protein
MELSRPSTVLGTIEHAKYCFGYDRAMLTELSFGLKKKKFHNLQFLFIFFAEIAHTEVKFDKQIYHKNI